MCFDFSRLRLTGIVLLQRSALCNLSVLWMLKYQKGISLSSQSLKRFAIVTTVSIISQYQISLSLTCAAMYRSVLRWCHVTQVHQVIITNYMAIRSAFYFFCAKGSSIGEASFSMKANTFLTFCRDVCVHPCCFHNRSLHVADKFCPQWQS